jgi:hypothetical protein
MAKIGAIGSNNIKTAPLYLHAAPCASLHASALLPLPPLAWAWRRGVMKVEGDEDEMKIGGRGSDGE